MVASTGDPLTTAERLVIELLTTYRPQVEDVVRAGGDWVTLEGFPDEVPTLSKLEHRRRLHESVDDRP